MKKLCYLVLSISGLFVGLCAIALQFRNPAPLTKQELGDEITALIQPFLPHVPPLPIPGQVALIKQQGWIREIHLQFYAKLNGEPAWFDIPVSADSDPHQEGQGIVPAPSWPVVHPQCEGQPKIGCERFTGQTTEYYYVYYADLDMGQWHEEMFPQDQWEKYTVGKTVFIPYDDTGHLLGTDVQTTYHWWGVNDPYSGSP